MERQRTIVITPEENKCLQKIFGCSHTTVWEAVKFIGNRDLHKRIRVAALKRGNQQMVLVPEFDTIYIVNREDADETEASYMIQPFVNGATLEVNRTTGKVSVRNKRGEVVYTCDNLALKELKAIQEMAMSL